MQNIWLNIQKNTTLHLFTHISLTSNSIIYIIYSADFFEIANKIITRKKMQNTKTKTTTQQTQPQLTRKKKTQTKHKTFTTITQTTLQQETLCLTLNKKQNVQSSVVKFNKQKTVEHT